MTSSPKSNDWTRSIASIAGPRYLAIVKAVELALDTGDLRPGDRLPPQRDLAKKVGVNIGTVSRAYAMMRDSGVTSGEVGRGTFLQEPAGVDGPSSLWERSAPRSFIDLSHSFPDEAPVHPAAAEILREWHADIDIPSLLARQIDAGLRRHRAIGAHWLSRFGLECGPDDVMITCGGQHGLLLAMAALSRAGDVVMTEELAFYGLKSAAGMMGRQLVSVRMDREGLMPQYLDIVCRRTGAKVLFCTPTLHNPTTAIMSLERRHEILEVCRRHDVTIVEDDVWNFMLDTPAVPFAALDPDRTVYVTSFSKIIGPGLRVGLLRMPRHAQHALGVALRATTLMASAVTTEHVVRLLTSKSIETVIAALRTEARARQAILTGIISERHLITRPEAYYAWLKLTNGWSAEAFVREAHKRDVGITPFTVFEVSSLNHSDGIRICINGARDRSTLETALHRLRTLLLDETPRVL
ncbi:GntR family transcriptional regulator [Kaistia sp. 32K]|uniref:aminotransferase-like domain-containing protein n=1 Tax=Kaistia sp. 32K TaxID=2795690 RepID=UPI0019167D14|nr:PLP-dependent aminotransferase family protein [Kaistia sp. 32K]BCP54023.1 GntR family transcriptional regulator [Kaistia sp. 32K]